MHGAWPSQIPTCLLHYVSKGSNRKLWFCKVQQDSYAFPGGWSLSVANQSSVFSKSLNRNDSTNKPDIPGCTVRVQICYVALRFLRTDVYTSKNGLTQAFCTFNNTFKMSWTLLIVSKNRAKAVYEYISICNKIKFINYER